MITHGSHIIDERTSLFPGINTFTRYRLDLYCLALIQVLDGSRQQLHSIVDQSGFRLSFNWIINQINDSFPIISESIPKYFRVFSYVWPPNERTEESSHLKGSVTQDWMSRRYEKKISLFFQIWNLPNLLYASPKPNQYYMALNINEFYITICV